MKGEKAADLRLWAAYTQGVRLLPGKSRPAVPEPPEPAGPAGLGSSSPRPCAPAAALAQVGVAPGGLDRASWQKFRSGRMAPARVLDLHGLTAARAHQAVIHFIQRAQAEQLRVIEIITGKGEILLRELPYWLDSPQLRPLILALAHPHAANTGALRILLRRSRP